MKAKLLLPALLFSLIVPFVALSSGTTYSDLASNHIYAPAVQHFTESGLVRGYDDGSFGVDAEINRVEALKIIMSYWNVSASTDDVNLVFTDIEAGAWYEDSLKQALSLEIINGYPDGSFLPEATVNRVEALKMIFLAGDMVFPNSDDEYWYAAYLDYAIQNALLNSGPDGDYAPDAPLTRGEFLDILHRMKENPYTGETEYGVASYYSYSMDGVNTASGTPLAAYGFMTAHKTLPFGTWIRVTNLENNESVDVEVVDRGPYVEGRVVDLTPAAFEAIGWLGSGVLNVRIEVLSDTE